MQEQRRQLDWELSLDSGELVSHGWYHGALERATAEARLPRDGGFLVRDSTTQPGHYVLSCRHAGHYLHFVINRVVIQPDTVYEHFQYQFEGEAFDTVPDLVTSYVGSGDPISMASGARITTPANRSAPLLCRSTVPRGPLWKSAYAQQGSVDLKACPPADPLRKTTSLCCPHKNQGCGMSCSCPGANHANHTANDISLSNQRKTGNMATKSLSFSEQNALMTNAYNAFSLQSGEDFNAKKQRSLSLSPGEMLIKSTSADGVIRAGAKNPKSDESKDFWDAGSQQENPPAKPARTQAPVYQASGSDSGNGSGDSAQSSAPNDVHPGNMPRSASKLTIRRLDVAHEEESLMSMQTIEFRPSSVIDTEPFRSELFSSIDNKPLESDTLQTIKLLLRSSGPMILAMHLTRVDLKFIMGPSTEKNNNPLDKIIGLELCLLAHGEQMRMDIIERAECIKFLIVVTILTCQSDAERADVLNDWIQLAIETKTALGNLFGFSTIMLGLCTKQINSMENMWNILRQKHTYAAFTFESKLRPSFKNMNDCIDSSPPNTTIPHIMPAVMLLSSAPDCEKRWEEYGGNTADYGLSVMAAHLEAARKYPEQQTFYERNTKVALAATPAPVDDALLDLFRTEFHIKFLWGSRGGLLPHFERHSKLSDVVTTMAERYLTPAK